MKIADQGKGFIQILLLAAVLIVGVALFAPQFLPNKPTIPNFNNQPQTSTTPVPVVALSLLPAQINTSVNQTFNLEVNIDTKTETVSAIELHLTYDPNLLEATAIKNGTLLPVILAQGKLTSGGASIVVGASPTAPQKGSGLIATVTFKAKKAGMAKITVDKATQVAAIGKNSNALGSSSETIVNIK